MAKVYLICGKICSGKSHYSKKLQEEIGGVILSPDEATFDLIENCQGEFYNQFIKRLISYLNKKSVDIVKGGCNVIYERGLWSRDERETIRKYYKENKIECEIHYIKVNDELWHKQIESRNKMVQEGKGGSNFFLDEGLMNKLKNKFEEPQPNEIDKIIERR